MDVKGPVRAALDLLDQNLPIQQMQVCLAGVHKHSVPRRRTLSKIRDAGSISRSLTDVCVFCRIILEKKGEGIPREGTHKIYEDNDMVAFQAANQAAKTHILVCPKQHIVSHSHLRNTQEDKDLLEAMLGVGRRLIQEQEGKELEPCQMKFGFHTQPFPSVSHLHLHCLVLPHSPLWMGYQYVQTQHGTLGFVTVDQVLRRLESQDPGT